MPSIDDTCSCGMCDDYSRKLHGAEHEIADLRRRLDIETTRRVKAEAERDRLVASVEAIDSSLQAQLDRAEKAEASRDRLAAECRAWRLDAFNQKNDPDDPVACADSHLAVRRARAAVDAAGDLEGKP